MTVANPLGQPDTTGFGDAFVPHMLSYDMDSDAPRIFARTATYRESAMDFMFTSGVDYREFRRSGGKLLVYTGQADPVFSAKYHVAWYRRLIAASGGLKRTRRFARVFLRAAKNLHMEIEWIVADLRKLGHNVKHWDGVTANWDDTKQDPYLWAWIEGVDLDEPGEISNAKVGVSSDPVCRTRSHFDVHCAGRKCRTARFG